MRVVIQRVSSASVVADGMLTGSIQAGLLILLGITHNDTPSDVDKLVKKISALRIFSDEQGKMNLSVKDIHGDILVVSQFTLYASTKKGNRPSFTASAPPPIAIPLYEYFLQKMGDEIGKPIQAGIFGADMKVSLLNDGPVTIIIDTNLQE
jgi:D-tyrosyl-tRNA(Tyr) deacylase